MAVPLLDLSRQYDLIKDDLNTAVSKVMAHCGYVLGPEVKELESAIAKLCTVGHARGVASGTDALLLALKAAGVEPGDEVITTNFSFFATAGVIARLGARPVFVDIEPDTYNIDPSLIELAITDKTKAIVPVHLFGQCADMDPINKIAARHNLKVIEDAAQAIGSEYKGKRAGSLSDFGCFSFYPSKNLGAAGDGGIIVCDNQEDDDLLNILRMHGSKPKYYHRIVGYNSRLATVQAAVLLVKLPYLDGWSRKRIEHARIYNEAFAEVESVRTPVVKDYTTFHIYNQYTIAVPERDRVQTFLRERGIGNEIYYPVPFHVQDCFSDLGYAADEFPVTRKAAAEVLSIPIYPEMTDTEQQEVIAAVKEAVAAVAV